MTLAGEGETFSTKGRSKRGKYGEIGVGEEWDQEDGHFTTKDEMDNEVAMLAGGNTRFRQPRVSLLGKPLNYRAHRKDMRYRKIQARVYNFLERPKDWGAWIYHFLEFLATGESFRSLGFRFRMGFTTVRKIVQETIKVIWNRLHATEMAIPGEIKWTSIADRFFARCDFPLCLGAIDGKHVKIKAPRNSGSKYFNYKGHHSVVLMAIADADCKFTVIDVGAYGSNSDGGIIQDSTFYKLLMSQKLNIPEPSTIPGTDVTVPFVFVADEAFPLLSNLMRPFPRRELTDEKRQFNYRLSRARRQVESAFGILTSMWRVLLGTIEVHDKFACDIVKAVCVLHNMILNKEEERIPHISNDETVMEEEILTNNILPVYNRRPGNEAMFIRDTFMSYFTSPNGSLPWQNN